MENLECRNGIIDQYLVIYPTYRQMVKPDITFVVQQCARFCDSSNQDHDEAVKRICR